MRTNKTELKLKLKEEKGKGEVIEMRGEKKRKKTEKKERKGKEKKKRGMKEDESKERKIGNACSHSRYPYYEFGRVCNSLRIQKESACTYSIVW